MEVGHCHFSHITCCCDFNSCSTLPIFHQCPSPVPGPREVRFLLTANSVTHASHANGSSGCCTVRKIKQNHSWKKNLYTLHHPLKVQIKAPPYNTNLWVKKVPHLFYDNYGKYRQILIIVSLLNSRINCTDSSEYKPPYNPLPCCLAKTIQL